MLTDSWAKEATNSQEKPLLYQAAPIFPTGYLHDDQRELGTAVSWTYSLF